MSPRRESLEDETERMTDREAELERLVDQARDLLTESRSMTLKSWYLERDEWLKAAAQCLKPPNS